MPVIENEKGFLTWDVDPNPKAEFKRRNFRIFKDGQKFGPSVVFAVVEKLNFETAEDNKIEVTFNYETPSKKIVSITRVLTAAMLAKAAADAEAQYIQDLQQQMANGAKFFHNPSNFVPYVPLKTRPPENSGLRRMAPTGHHAYFDGHFTGSITVKIEAKTPLLLPDTSRTTWNEKDHGTYKTLRDANENPVLKPTALKGPLRAAFEAITNSRFGVFGKYDAPLGRRMEAEEGQLLVPVRVADNGQKLEILLGSHLLETSKTITQLLPCLAPNHMGKLVPSIPGNMVYAAWLPRYDQLSKFNVGRNRDDTNTETPSTVLYPKELVGEDKRVPAHADKVFCRFKKVKYVRGGASFFYWRVIAIVPHEHRARINEFAAVLQSIATPESQGTHESLQEMIDGWGYVCISNRNIGNKHDERVFFVPVDEELDVISCPTQDIDPSWRSQWNTLIKDYAAANKPERERRKSKSEGERTFYDKKKPAMSRHVLNAGDEAELKPGTLCYARVDNGKITGLFPVMIARELMPSAPSELLPPHMQPLQSSFETLSPAERVFGWVHPKASDVETKNRRTAYRGQLRIHSINFKSGGVDAVPHNGSVPLAILGSPKPQQTRFYGAIDSRGSPLVDGKPKNDIGYNKSGYVKGLRGRKFYLHDRTATHWDLTQPRKPWAIQPINHESCTNQNHSIKDWVKPCTVFEARIDLTNLHEAELAALLWLLNLGSDGKHCLKVGGGKPLGFGSVRVTLTDMKLRDGAAMRADFMQLGRGDDSKGTRLALSDVPNLVDKHLENLRQICEQENDADNILTAFERACTGPADDVQVRYPFAVKNGGQAVPESFAWFVQNERTEGQDQRKVALPRLWQQKALRAHLKPN